MQRYIVLLPTQSTIESIWKLRKDIVSQSLGALDPRGKTLPHITVNYLGEVDDTQAEKLKINLDKILLPNISSLEILDLAKWKDNIVALFDYHLLQGLVNDLQVAAETAGAKANLDYIGQYGHTIGDHMKIVREVEDSNQLKVIEYIKQNLPSPITLERLALINFGCKEEDIIWQKIIK